MLVNTNNSLVGPFLPSKCSSARSRSKSLSRVLRGPLAEEKVHPSLRGKIGQENTNGHVHMMHQLHA